MADAPAAPVPAVVPAAEQQEGKVVESQSESIPNSKKIFVGNLHYSVTSEQLKTFFKNVEAEILSCEVIQRRTRRGVRSAGYGFVEVSTDEALKKAIDELNDQSFEGRNIIVAPADSAEEKEKKRGERKVKSRVGRRGSKAVPGEVTEAEANGEAEKPTTTTDAEGDNKLKKKKKRGNTKKVKKTKRTPEVENDVPLENGDGAAASATEGEKKKKPRPKRAPKPRRAAGEEPSGQQSKTTLFVANLPFSVDDDGLADIFKKAEFTVTSARVVRWHYGHPRKSKGFGFVSFNDEEQQLKALEALQDAEIPSGNDGVRKITLKIAVDPAHDESDLAEKGDAPTPGGAATETPAW